MDMSDKKSGKSSMEDGTKDQKEFPWRNIVVVLGAEAVFAAFLICSFAVDWTKVDLPWQKYELVHTDYYDLELPKHWGKDSKTKTEEMNEIYGGRDQDGQKYIPEETYRLVTYMKRKGQAPVFLGAVEMYTYLEDCQDLGNWEYAGQIHVKISENNGPYKRFRSYVVINNGEAPEDFSKRERALFLRMQGELSEAVRNMKIEHLEPANSDQTMRAPLYVSFSENTDGRHYGAETWEQKYERLSEYNQRMNAIKDTYKKPVQNQTTAKPSASSKTVPECKKPGCHNMAVRNGFCYHHAYPDAGKDDYYKNDFESFYEDNADDYDDEDDAYEAWEEEYGGE